KQNHFFTEIEEISDFRLLPVLFNHLKTLQSQFSKTFDVAFLYFHFVSAPYSLTIFPSLVELDFSRNTITVYQLSSFPDEYKSIFASFSSIREGTPFTSFFNTVKNLVSEKWTFGVKSEDST
ncbi:MAG: hypothetical protein J5897_04720, partial [Candidatus Methanomethylophilus sp.]|nr:hypothetical protein [Methanomethylophilus sp.]